MKSIETHARAFLALIILPIGTVTDPWYRPFVQNLGADYRPIVQKKKIKSFAEFVVIDTYDYDTYIRVIASLCTVSTYGSNHYKDLSA